MKTGIKTFRFMGSKQDSAAGADTTPTAEQLAKINLLTKRAFAADELYVRQMRLAHNAIDRDEERFTEGMIANFAATAVRKTLLMDHDKYDTSRSALGKFFDVEIEKMSPAEAEKATGETFRLPPTVDQVMFLSPWYYIPRAAVDKQTIVKIDAGVFDFTSIGFRAETLVPVCDDMGNHLYCEYRGRGEMTEGSYVYLGAQQGASSKELGGGNPSEGQEARGVSPHPLYEKRVVAFHTTPMADPRTAWDGAASRAAVAKWASSDGSGDKDKVDWTKYAKAFAWFNDQIPHAFGSYKLPHHDVVSGELRVVWNGVHGAMAALHGGRGGVDIPAADQDGVYNHLSKEYALFKQTPPPKGLDFEDWGEEYKNPDKGGTGTMKNLVAKLAAAFGKAFTEDEEKLFGEIKALVEAKDTEVGTQKTRIAEFEARIAALTPLADDGKAYRDGLVTSYVMYKAKLGECAETPEAQKVVKDVIVAYPVDFLKSEVAHLQARVNEKFPKTKGELNGDMRQDKTGEGGEAKSWKEDNPLVPKETKEAVTTA